MPKISLKTPEEIKIMAEGGKRLGQILDTVLEKVEPGLSTLEIDTRIDKLIAQGGGTPSFKLVPHYHWASCIGLNEEVVHSIPQSDNIIKRGDLLKIDLGMFFKGFHTDLSWTVEVQSAKKLKFLRAGEKALAKAITMAIPGNRIGHISQAIETVIGEAGYFPVEVLTGHGIGRQLHEEPLIPGVFRKKMEDTPLLVPGMCLAIEVIYSADTGEVVLEEDNWTISTKDGKIAGLFEKTIAVTKNKPLILTPLKLTRGKK